MGLSLKKTSTRERLQGGAARINMRVPSCYHRTAVLCLSVFPHALERLAVHVALGGEVEATVHELIEQGNAGGGRQEAKGVAQRFLY
jgi:hypothetical protein